MSCAVQSAITATAEFLVLALLHVKLGWVPQKWTFGNCRNVTVSRPDTILYPAST